MHITTVHTLAFTIKCVGNEQHTAAMAIIKTGAAYMGLTVNVTSLPMPDGNDPSNRNSSIQAMSGDHDQCAYYWGEVMRALTLIGVEATSP